MKLMNKPKKMFLKARKTAWNNFISPIKEEQQELVSLFKFIASQSENKVFIEK
jgi:hypothetical protein